MHMDFSPGQPSIHWTPLALIQEKLRLEPLTSQNLNSRHPLTEQINPGLCLLTGYFGDYKLATFVGYTFLKCGYENH